MGDINDNPSTDSERDNLPHEQIESLKSLIDSSSRIVAFTGAGVSAESGIPTYRGAGGHWRKYDPNKFASIDYFVKDPTYYWRFFREERHNDIVKADPNPAHYAIAELEKRGKLSTVITQNIEGLHFKAGSKRVLELHGNTTRFYCYDCHNGYSIEQVWKMLQSQMPPLCEKCNGVIRPDVVLYGEMLPQDVVNEAINESESCDFMLVVGSSLVVYPAANLPYQAKMSGARLAIINIDPTPLDSLADLVINYPAGEVLAEAVLP